MTDKNNKTQTPVKDFFKYRFNLDADKANEPDIIEVITRNVEFKGTNLWTLIFAIFIASIGLNVNSTAVIIGAMLISPLMGPIMGIGLGIGIFDFKLVKIAVKNLLIAVLISLATSTIYFLITPLDEARSELLARTVPTIWDVLIAIFGGLAGIIAITRKSMGNAIPGVAIATALMPPLCTAGYGLSNGEWYYFFGAFYLFLINTIFISISTFLIVKFLKFKPKQFIDKAVEQRVRKTIWIIAVLTILPSLYLAYRFVQQEVFNRQAKNFINKEIKARNLYIVDRNINPETKEIKLVIFGDSLNDSVSKKIMVRASLYGLNRTKIDIRQTLNKNDRSKDSEELTEGLQNHLLANDKKILLLSEQLKKYSAQASDTLLYDEFNALFGKTKQLAITRTAIFEENIKDTVLLVFYELEPNAKKISQLQMESWLKERTKIKSVKIISR